MTETNPQSAEHNTCAHWWKCDEAKSKYVWATCKLCGMRKQFVAYVSEDEIYGVGRYKNTPKQKPI